jgi:hypothetical protein
MLKDDEIKNIHNIPDQVFFYEEIFSINKFF